VLHLKITRGYRDPSPAQPPRHAQKPRVGDPGYAGSGLRKSLAALLLALAASAAPQHPSAAETVMKFCWLDAHGARTDSRLPSFHEIDEMNLWEAEPGWDTVAVITKYRVVAGQQSGKKATVTVKYDVAGKIADSDWEEAGQTETVNFTLEYSARHWSFPDNAAPALVKAPLRWRITDPVLMPHVSLGWAIAEMKKQIASEKDATEKTKKQKVLDRLYAIENARPAL